MAHENSSTKSIDVGSVFLMDLSVNESEHCGNANHQTTGGHDFTSATKTLDNDQVFPRSLHVPHEITLRRNNDTHNHHHNHHHQLNNQPLSAQKSIVYSGHFTVRPDEELDDINPCDYLGESLDRLACVIDGVDHRQLKERRRLQLLETNAIRNLNPVTIVETHRPPEVLEQRPYHQSSLSSLSDESFGISSCGGDGNSLSVSYTASSEPEDEDLERSSTATREDSGVLDMKDLDSQFNDDSYDVNEQLNEGHLGQKQEKPISANIRTVTNLINNNKSAELNDNPKDDSNNMGLIYNTSSRSNSNNAPTTKNNNNNHHNHHHHHNYHNNYRVGSSKRPMSASLPIQVPARQMKRDVRKLKLNQIGKEATITQAGLDDDDAIDNQSSSRATRPLASKKLPIDSLDAIADELDDEFLQQEYNENHHNHYPVDEFDQEHVRADENPMKLFESIQALARSLLEDAELFGSLPPKRMLESPIRSLAFA